VPVADFIVDTGDAAVLLPIAFVIFVVLYLTDNARAALAWACAVASCGAAIGALKFATYACAPVFVGASLRSPSGHAGLATAVYGSLAVLLIARVSHVGIKVGVLSLIVAWIGAIAIASVKIHAHSVSEVVVGAAVGAASVLLVRAHSHGGRALKGRLSIIVLVAVACLVLLHGKRVEAEATIEQLGSLIGRSTGCSAWR
jgi:membrane-associated phospholipid phosphatase